MGLKQVRPILYSSRKAAISSSSPRVMRLYTLSDTTGATACISRALSMNWQHCQAL